MTQEDKLLLFTDLTARLRYGVIVHYEYKWDTNISGDGSIRNIYIDDCLESDFAGIVIGIVETGLGYIKPYLRLISSMTEEEKLHLELNYGFELHGDVLSNLHIIKGGGYYEREGEYVAPTEHRQYKHITIDTVLELIKWLNAHHFDYRGLIEKRLALEAPDGMYNIN